MSGIPGGALDVSVHDDLSGFTWQHEGGRWFHAAGIMKVAVLAAVFDAIDAGRFSAESRVHGDRGVSASERVGGAGGAKPPG